MAASYTLSETYGTSPGTTADNAYANLLSADIASGSDTTTVPNANPVTRPGADNAYSYERWVRGHWTGTFTSISNVKFWKAAGTPQTGVTINAGDKGNQTYVTPVNTASSVATSSAPESQGAGLSLGYATAYSDYVVLQMVVASTATQGNTGAMTWRMGWDEI